MDNAELPEQLSVLTFHLVFQIPNHVAIKIALELKKLLIDNSLLDVYVILLTSLLLTLSFFFFSLMDAIFFSFFIGNLNGTRYLF